MNTNEYFQYILSDNYLCKNDYKLNESFETNLYENEFSEFSSVPLSDMLPMIYIMENNNFTDQDLVLLESGYEQYANSQSLNEFMGSGQHLYRNQIGVGATDWMRGVSGPLKWLGGLLAGTLAGLFGLLTWLVRKGQQAIGVALLKRYITKIAAITDEGYKNMCTLWTSRKNRACFRTFQQASERDIIVSVDVCAKALGLLNNSLGYKEDQNPYNTAETLISDVHSDYLKPVKISSGFLGFNKLVDKPQEKIDNTKDIAEKYDIHIGNAYNKMQQSNHQQADPASNNESFNYSGYDSLNEYKAEKEHYGSTGNYAKYMDAYLVAARNAWETLCKRLIGEVRIGDEVEYLKNNEKLNLTQDSQDNLPKSPTKFRSYIESNPPGENLDEWLRGFVKIYWRMDDNKIDKIFRDFAGEDDTRVIKPAWKKLKKSYNYWRRNQTSENMNKIWYFTNTILNELKDNIQNESVLYKNKNILNEILSAGEGVNTWRAQDIDNNLVHQMSNWLQRKDRFEWKITNDFKKKCTELATAVDKEIITRINRWTTPSGAPGQTGINSKGFNSPITKAGLEKLWAAYKEELNNRIEARVDNFVTGNPFMYAVQFLQFTVPSLMKDVLNTVDPVNLERNYIFDYSIISDHCRLEDNSSDQENPSATAVDLVPLTEEERTIKNLDESQNESFIMFKGRKFQLFEEENYPDKEEDDSDINDDLNLDQDDEGDENQNNDNQSEETSEQKDKLLITGYSAFFKVIKKDQVKNIADAWNNKLNDGANPWLFLSTDPYPLASVNSFDKIAKMNIFENLIPGANLQNLDTLKKYFIYIQLDENGDSSLRNFPLLETSLNELKQLYKNENVSESIEYNFGRKLFEADEEVDDANINSQAVEEDDKENNSSAEKWINNYVIVKLPIFWYGDKALTPENPIQENWITMELPDSLKNKFIEEMSKESEDDKVSSELTVWWPLPVEDIEKVPLLPRHQEEEREHKEHTENTENSSRTFDYTKWESLNETDDVNESLGDDTPIEGNASNDPSTGKNAQGTEENASNDPSTGKNSAESFEEVPPAIVILNNTNVNNNNKEEVQTPALSINTEISLNEQLKDRYVFFTCKDLRKQAEKNLEIVINISSNLQGIGSDIEIIDLNSEDPWNEQDDYPKIIGSVKLSIKSLEDFKDLKGVYNNKVLGLPFNIIRNIINIISVKVKKTLELQQQLKNTDDEKLNNDQKEYKKMVCRDEIQYKNFSVNINFKAGNLSMDEALSDDKNKYKDGKVKQADIITIKNNK